MIDLPNPGDRVTVYQQVPLFTPSHTPEQIRSLAKHPWAAPLDPTRPRFRCWGDWAIVVLRRQRKGGETWLTVTATEFPEPLRSHGVRVPLSHVELVEAGYGLPELTIAPVPSAPEPVARQEVLF